MGFFAGGEGLRWSLGCVCVCVCGGGGPLGYPPLKLNFTEIESGWFW